MGVDGILEEIHSLSFLHRFESEDATLLSVDCLEKIFVILKTENSHFEVSITLKQSQFRLATLLVHDADDADSNIVYAESKDMSKFLDLLAERLQYDR